MGSTFGINENAVWMPQFGSFDWAVERISERLRDSDPALAAELLDAREMSMMFVDELAPERFKNFEAATVAGFEDVVADVSREPKRYGWFLALFSELKAIVRLDPRASGEANDEVSVVLDGNVVWRGPRWLAESLLECPAGWLLYTTSAELGRRLLEARGSAWSGVIDLSYLLSLPDDDAAAVREAVGRCTVWSEQALVTVAPEYLPRVHAALVALGEALAIRTLAQG